MYKYLILISMLIGLFAGCNKELPIYTSKEYKNIDKDIILNAAKKVILLSDDRYNVQSKINSIKATRLITRFKAYDINLEINTINLNAYSENNATFLELRINQKYDYLDKNEKIIKGKSHQLLWDRMDYILGLNKNWPTCFDNLLNRNYDGVLCDIIYNQNNNAVQSDVIKDNNKTEINNYISEESNDIKKIDLSQLDGLVLPNTKEKTLNNNLKIKELELEEMEHTLPIINNKENKIKKTDIIKEPINNEKLDSNVPIKEINLEKNL